MSDSLRDQLVKSGLTTEQQVKHTRKEKTRGKKRSKRDSSQAKQPSQAQQAAIEKRDYDRALNQRRDAERQREADEKRARQEVIDQEIPHDGEVAFNFTHNDRIKKINVSADQRQALIAGKLAIARTRGHFRLIPRSVADRARQAAPFLVAFIAEAEEVDPAYEEHPVPDDLLW